MSEFDPAFHLRPPPFRTVRECRLEQTVSNWKQIGIECLPYLIAHELEQSSEKITGLIERIVSETKGD